MGTKSSKTNKTNSSIQIFSQILSPLPDSFIPTQSQPSIYQHPQQPSLRTYIILLNSDQQNNCIRSLNLRKKYPQQLIQIKYGNLLQSQKQYIKIKVYVEYIVINLQQFINIHFSDMMPIFYKVFKGFKTLYEQFGSFAPDPRMIGFNQLAQVKVWAHTKYSKSKPQISYQMYDQQKMVQSLIQIFSNKIDINTLPIDSHRRKFNISAKTFDQAIKFIQSQVQSIQLIPKSIKSIAQLLHSGRKINQNQIISMNSQFYHKGIQKTIKFKYSNPDPNQINKPKINFTFQGHGNNNSKSLSPGPKHTSTSIPKINFTASTTPKKSTNTNISFTASSPNQSKNNNQSSRTIIQSLKTQKPKVTFTKPNQNSNSNSNANSSISYNKNGRSTSLVKFTYK